MMYLLRLLSLLRPYPWRIATASLTSIVATSGWLLIPIVVKRQLAGATGTESVMGIPMQYSLGLVLTLGGGLLLLTLTSYVAVFVIYEIAHRVSADLRLGYVDHLLKLPLAVHRNQKSGDLIDRLVVSIIDIERFLKEALIGLLAGTILFWGCIVMIFWLSWQLALTVIITVPLLSLSMRWLMDEARRTFHQGKSAGGVLTAYIHDILLGIEAAKAVNAREHEIRRFQERQSDLLVRLRKWAVRGALIEPLMVSAAAITVTVVLVYGNWLVTAGTLDSGSYITFLFYVALLIPQARGISMLLLGWQQFCNGIRRLDEILSIPVEEDLPGSVPLRKPVTGKIEFSHVTHSYPDRSRALDDVSFVIEPLECVGIVGASGAGKTTLFNLLLRFYQPSSGIISVDGSDIRRTTASSLRDAIAIVPQDVILFNDTILNNIRYGRWDATDTEVQSACRAAQVEEFIFELPRQYLTNVGERGIQLSGGQRQRLAIARALLRNAPVLLLDEATSSLDTQTERQLQEAMRLAMRGRTTIIIAHRLATVVHLPRLIVLEEGRVLDEGSHEELLLRCERYRNLVVSQLIGFHEPQSEGHRELAP